MNQKTKKIIIVSASVISTIALVCLIGIIFFVNGLVGMVKNNADSSGLQTLPCDSAIKIELGVPFKGGPTAEFTTQGGKLYIAASNFDHTGIFGTFRGSTEAYFGVSTTFPTLDSKRNIITNMIKSVNVWEGKYTDFDLPAGRYWLWLSRGSNIVIYSCKPNGVSDPKPVGQTMK